MVTCDMVHWFETLRRQDKEFPILPMFIPYLIEAGVKKFMLGPTALDNPYIMPGGEISGHTVTAISRKSEDIEFDIASTVSVLVESLKKFDILYKVQYNPPNFKQSIDHQTFAPTFEMVYAKGYFIIRGVLKDA